MRKLARKGQVSVPAAIRDALGLKEGDKVAFALSGPKKNEVTLRPVPLVAEMTFGKLASPVPMRSPKEERDAFAEAMVEGEVGDIT